MAVTSFSITVPRKNNPGQQPITELKAIVAVDDDSPVTFKVTDPRGMSRDIGPAWPGSTNPVVAFVPKPAESQNPDELIVLSPPNNLLENDPLCRRYEFWFELLSDYDPNNHCANTMTTDSETWSIQVIEGPPITSVCLLSFELNSEGSECQDDDPQVVPVDEVVAWVVDFPPATPPCREFRPGVDCVLVLDRSGSMASSTLGDAPQRKIEALRDAVTDFVTVWNNMRTSEGGAAPVDNVGVALFDHDASWWPATFAGLNVFAAQQATIPANVGTITPAGLTSIGDGLLLADGVLNNADATRRRVILLMSDGKQNADQRVGVFDGQVVTHTLANPDNKTALPNQSKYQIYSVTVGAGAAVSAQINQEVATATKGFYINSETNAGQMSSFFLELLQNFLRFNSWETYRLVSERVSRTQPYSSRLRVTTTTQYLVVNLRWPQQMAALRLSVTPPGEAEATVGTGTESITLRFDLPTSPTYDYLGEWKIEIDVIRAPAADQSAVPFELVVLGEDAAFDSQMDIAPRDYVPGDEIELSAKLTEFGRPLAGLAGQPDATLVARVVKPGVSIGDLLSESQASTDPPSDQDTYSAADAKLFNELQKNPGALVRDDSDTVTLVDSGDGVYRGRYAVRTPGHYTFLFGLTGRGRNTGGFSRMQLKTVYVRPAPDPAATEIQTSIDSKRGNHLLVSMTPRTKFGNKLGPGWANYFWFKTPGRPAVKAQDNLDGTYSATVPFSGPAPVVSLHFLSISMVIGDSVTEDKLPVSLDASNAFIPVVGVPDVVRRLPKWLLWLIILLLILFVLWLLWQGLSP